jgi:hypothetical protein
MAGRPIDKLSSLYGPKERWIWALKGAPGAIPKWIRLAGEMGALDDAAAELKKSWEQWLAWADLSAAHSVSDPPPTPATAGLGLPLPENGGP